MSFHQGHPKFGETAGVQCTCNTFFALCWAEIKRATIWTSWHLEISLLSVRDLPCNLEIEGHPVFVERLEHEIKTNNTFNYCKHRSNIYH